MQRIITLVVLSLTMAAVSTVRADEGAEKAQKIINRAIKAMGGSEALEKKKIVVMKETGTYYGMDDALPYESEYKMQFPKRSRMEIINVFTIVVNDTQAWTSTMGETTEVEGDQLTEQREGMHIAYITSLIPLAKPGKVYRLSLAAEEKVDGELCDGVKVESDKHRSVKLFFSRKTGLLRKSEATVRSSELSEDVVQVTIYKDYRDVDNVKTAFKMVVNRDGKVYIESETTKVSYPKEADASWFKKP